MKNRILWAGAMASAVASFSVNALATNIAGIESNPSGTTGLTLDSGPVITYVGSKPGTYNGFTFSRYVSFVQDSSGGLALFGLPTGSAYVPTVGDIVGATGSTYSPFHQIPELAFPSGSTLSPISSGNSVPAPATYTIPQLNQTTLTLPDIAGHIIELDNVTIQDVSGGNGTFGNGQTGSAANQSYTVTDGVNSMVLFYWASSYSVDAQMYGQALPTGPVDIIGFDSVFTSGSTSTAEFTPFQITSVPEPTTFALGGCGLFALLAAKRRRN